MFDVASDIPEELGQSSGMLPRRWYTDEIAPPSAPQVRLSSQTWRYRIVARRKHEDATPTVGVASSFRMACDERAAYTRGRAASSSVSRTPSRANSSCASGHPPRSTCQPAALCPAQSVSAAR